MLHVAFHGTSNPSGVSLSSRPRSPVPALPFFYGWIIVAAGFVTMAIDVTARTAFSLRFPPILDEFGWERGLTAGAFSFGFLVSIISRCLQHPDPDPRRRTIANLLPLAPSALSVALALLGKPGCRAHSTGRSNLPPPSVEDYSSV